MPKLSIIIPIGPKEHAWRPLLKDLQKLEGPCEIILSATKPPLPDQQNLMREISKSIKCSWISGPEGRANQQNLAAQKASGDWLCFLHADSRLSQSSLKALRLAISQDEHESIYYFDLHFFGKTRKRLFLNRLGVRLRNQTWGVPYGDQGLTLSKKSYDRLGGFKDSISIGEDHEFVWRALDQGHHLAAIGAPIQTSARKYNRQGWFITSLRHNLLGSYQAWQFGWQPRLRKILRGAKKS